MSSHNDSLFMITRVDSSAEQERTESHQLWTVEPLVIPSGDSRPCPRHGSQNRPSEVPFSGSRYPAGNTSRNIAFAHGDKGCQFTYLGFDSCCLIPLIVTVLYDQIGPPSPRSTAFKREEGPSVCMRMEL